MRERKMVRKIFPTTKPALVIVKEIIKPEVTTTFDTVKNTTTVEVQHSNKIQEKPSSFLCEVAKAKEESYSDESFLWNLKELQRKYITETMFDESRYEFQLKYLAGRINIIKTRLKIND